jgi:hypothetical protein
MEDNKGKETGYELVANKDQGAQGLQSNTEA